MKELIDEMFEIIKDHREEERFMTKGRIRLWINEFKLEDREFIMKQTIHILKSRYVSKAMGREHVKMMLDFLKKGTKCESVADFVSQAYFFDLQNEDKSQKHLLNFMEEILVKDYKTSLSKSNQKDPKYFVYLDDILCTGQSVVQDLCKEKSGWFNKPHPEGGSNYDFFKKIKGKLILGFLAVHTKCTNKLQGRMYHELGDKDISYMRVWNTDFVIDNDPTVTNSPLNYLFPSEESLTDVVKEGKAHIEEVVNENGRNKEKEIAWRAKGKPKNETLFTSSEDRVRYETIMLEKCLEIYNKSKIKERPRPRPLGYGQVTEMGFGFGTLIFTWRNVPFNTPLAFWYPYYGFNPLFERKFT